MRCSVLALAVSLAFAAGCTLPRAVLSGGAPADGGSSMDVSVVDPEDTGTADLPDTWAPPEDDAAVVVPPDAGRDAGPTCPTGACCPPCGAGTTCTGGSCAPCGAAGQACCAGVCTAPATCMSGTCMAPMPMCGADGQACCSGDVCAGPSLFCDHPTFQAPRCRHCGATDEPCCPGDRCDVMTDTCALSACRACGTPYTHCCAGGGCLYTSHCDRGTCVY